MLETDLGQRPAANDFLSSQSKLERLRVVGMKDKEQSGKAVAQQHGSILAVALGFPHGYARFREIQLASGIRQNDEVIEGRIFFEFHLVVFPQLLLPHLLGTFYVRELIEEDGRLAGCAREQIVQTLRIRRRSRRIGGEAKP